MGMTYKVVVVKTDGTKNELESEHYTDEELKNFEQDGFYEPLFMFYMRTINCAAIQSKIKAILGLNILKYQIEAYDDGCDNPFSVATIDFNNINVGD